MNFGKMTLAFFLLIGFSLAHTISCGSEPEGNIDNKHYLSDCTKLAGSISGMDSYCCSFCTSWTDSATPAQNNDGKCIMFCNSCLPDDVTREPNCSP